MDELDLPPVVELDEQESDWVSWPAPGEYLPDDVARGCVCGHNNLGPDWHWPDCPTVLDAWRWRAKRLHDEVWELLAEVKALDGGA